MIYTTNAIESLHLQLRKVLKARGHFPSDCPWHSRNPPAGGDYG